MIMKRITFVLLLFAALIMTSGCGKQASNTDIEPASGAVPREAVEDIFSDYEKPDVEEKIRLIGENVEGVLDYFEKTGRYIEDALHDIGASNEDEARKACYSLLEPFEISVGTNADSIWLINGTGIDDSISTLLLYAENGIVTAFIFAPVAQSTVAEAISESELTELSSLSTEPRMEKLKGLAANGEEWIDAFGRLVYEENGCVIQIQVVRQALDGSEITDPGEMLPLFLYVEKQQ